MYKFKDPHSEQYTELAGTQSGSDLIGKHPWMNRQWMNGNYIMKAFRPSGSSFMAGHFTN